jgi:hypothetical protein
MAYADAPGAPVDSDAEFPSAVEEVFSRIPALREALSGTPSSKEELMLRAELRRTIGWLSGVLDRVATLEADVVRAAAYRTASHAARELVESLDAASSN